MSSGEARQDARPGPSTVDAPEPGLSVDELIGRAASFRERLRWRSRAAIRGTGLARLQFGLPMGMYGI